MNTHDLDARILRKIGRTPDVGVVEIASAIGEPLADVIASLRRLKRTNRVRTRGNTRATTYTKR